MSDIKVYMFPGVGSRMAINALEEISVPYSYQFVNLRNKEHLGDAYRAINPKQRIPSLKIDGRVLTENPAILWYLHTRFPAANLLPATDDLLARHQQLADLCWLSNTIHPTIRQIRDGSLWTTGDPEGVRENGRAKAVDFLDLLTERFGRQPYWYGEAWSIADLYIYWCYSTLERAGLSIDTHPLLLKHQEKVRSRPSFGRVLAIETEVAEAEGIRISL